MSGKGVCAFGVQEPSSLGTCIQYYYHGTFCYKYDKASSQNLALDVC
jgi:hypothetical protein